MDVKKSLPKDHLLTAIHEEAEQFKKCYTWLEKAMSPQFFEEVSHDNVLLITHSLMGFHLQDYFSTIHLKRAALVLCQDGPEADLQILKNYALYGIKYYKTYLSDTPPPFSNLKANLRIAVIYFTEAVETVEKPFPLEAKKELKELTKKRNPELTDLQFDKLIAGINTRFLGSLSMERLVLSLDMFFRAKTRDNCQYEVRYNEDWKETGAPSMQVVMAWKNTPKYNFLYRLAKTIHRHNLVMKRVNATYLNPYSKNSTLIMMLGLHGSSGKAAWDSADIPDFLRELVTVKYFASGDAIEETLVSKGVISGNIGNLLRAMLNFIHQILVHVDPNLYTLENITESLCRHPELTKEMSQCFEAKFHPELYNEEKYLHLRSSFIKRIQKLDTGQEENDKRRKNVFFQAMNMIHHTLKTNFYRTNLTAISFRLDPAYLDDVPFDSEKKFPEKPFAIFYVKGMHFFGFHIRFKDLSRGGLRTVYPIKELVEQERNNVFTECYNLAYTQHKKNKDIPEGGSKGVIFLKPYERIESEALILANELDLSNVDEAEIEKKIKTFKDEQSTEYLYQAQRAYIESLITIVNCEPDGKIRAKNIVDYWKKPEYLYLGPDENMHDSMIQWIADFSKKSGYKPGTAFITSKPKSGINHKEYGVTSRGVNVYMEQLLKYMGIKPETTAFTVKMTGGPDGDVAGNQICNLYRHFKNTAKLIALTDGSGTILDPKGLDLKTLNDLFFEAKGIAHYPAELLHDGGFLLNKHKTKSQTALTRQTLLKKKIDGELVDEWLSGSEMNYLLKHNVHQTKTDIFIPAGGRPRTLNDANIHDFLDETGKPTSRGIIEGANLYLTQNARRFLEERGTLIIKDSSANKTGVICSSFEVLSGLTLDDALFMQVKEPLVEEILEHLKELALNEAHLLLKSHEESGQFLTDISERISARINQFTYQLLDYFDTIPLSNDPKDPLVKLFLNYCPKILRSQFKEKLLTEIPDHHKKAIIACSIAAKLVYQKGLSWFPSIVDILPLLLK
ncbi:MAG TPA: NAD-glutamate dehydrogenase [Parachlamydiaceae bacterium]|nr:NAD-glutamate dehydrogenase [Parachlamydiaceae bacterium]